MTVQKDFKMIDWITFVQNPILSFILSTFGVTISFIGAVVGIYTLVKVKKVEQAQLDERSLTQELLDVDQIERDIKLVVTKLNQLNDHDSAALANALSQRLGAIQGTRRAIGYGNTMCLCTPGNAVSIEKGFFCSTHVDDFIDQSMDSIDIMTGSTRLIAGYYTMDKVKQACARGVMIRIIGLSPNASDDILMDASKTVSNPAPKTADEYRELIISNHKEISRAVKTWPTQLRNKFEYRESFGVPRLSIAKSDDTICLGFLQLFRDAQPDKIDDRQYIKIHKSSDLGNVVLKHFEMGWNESKKIIPDEDT